MADPGRLDELKRKFDENPKRYFAPLANEYRKAGDTDMAIELCRTFLPQQPGHMSGYIVYGQALHDAGQADESAAVFKQALTLDPENIIALRQLGDIARDAGDSAGAMRWYGKVLDLDPRNEEVAAYITSIASPGGTTAPPVSERVAPPTVRPEPEPDASAVRLEDIVSAPDTAQQPIMADEPAQRAYEAPEEPAAEIPDEPFEVTEWPSAMQPAADDTSGSSADSSLEGPWHAGSEAESQVEAEHHAEPLNSHAEAEEPSAPLRLSDYMTDEDSAFAPTAEELGEPATEQSHVPEAQATEESAPETIPDPAPESVQKPAEEASAEATPSQAAVTSATASAMEDSPFATVTMAELYMQQGLRGEALTIYRQLVLKRDDPTLHARIAELEAEGSHQPSGETVREFFTRIGRQRPDQRVELGADDTGEPGSRGASGDTPSPLASLFSTSEPDAGDVAAAQRLSGAFGTPRLGDSNS